MSDTDARSMESLLLSVPLEVRREIYKLVLDTGTVDPVTKSRLYIIKDRRALRLASRDVRINDYFLVNVNSKSIALEQTCGQIRDEIQHYLGEPVFKFTNISAFMGFLGYHAWNFEYRANGHNQITLQTAARVVVDVNKHTWLPYRTQPLSVWVEHDLPRLADLIVHPFMVTFVGEQGESSQELTETTNVWKERMDSRYNDKAVSQSCSCCASCLLM
jgi:hypothetical protein